MLFSSLRISLQLEKFMRSFLVLSVVFLLTAILFVIFQWFFPFVSFSTTEGDIYLEGICIQLLLALMMSILVLKLSSCLADIVLGGASGAVFFLSVLGIEIVDPTQIGWLMRGDWQWHFIGWHFFRGEAWQLPLGKITDFFYPVGTSIGYTDSIPLMALLFKPFHPFLPANFQYLGLWLFLCFILQGIFGMLLLRLITTNRFLRLIGALFFVTSPILLFRIGHVALSAHGLLLAGLWLYFKPWENHPFPSWAVLVSISALTHPYLAVMVLGLATAFYGRWWLVERRCFFYAAIGQLGLLGLLTLFLWWQTGYFLIRNTQMVAQTLGHYSMNLLAFVNPLGWSILIRDFPVATDGQYEGFGYLGAGLLLLGSWASYALISQPVPFSAVKRVLPLGIMVTGASLFALSPKVTFGSWVLFEVQYAGLAMLAPFQSSGRFLWLAYYFILFAIFKILITRHSASKALFFINFGLIIQFVDLQAIHHQYRTQRLSADSKTWVNPLKSEIWTIAAPHYRHLTFFPPIACGEPPADYLAFAYLAASNGLTINTGHAARFDAEKMGVYCQELFAHIQQGKIENDTIYVIHPAHLTAFKQLAQKPLSCAQIDGVDTCVSMESYLRWQDNFDHTIQQ